jgi:hypothetical protein
LTAIGPRVGGGIPIAQKAGVLVEVGFDIGGLAEPEDNGMKA